MKHFDFVNKYLKDLDKVIKPETKGESVSNWGSFVEHKIEVPSEGFEVICTSEIAGYTEIDKWPTWFLSKPQVGEEVRSVDHNVCLKIKRIINCYTKYDDGKTKAYYLLVLGKDSIASPPPKRKNLSYEITTNTISGFDVSVTVNARG